MKIDKETGLRECPFCGGKAMVRMAIPSCGILVHCLVCGVRTRNCDSNKEAIAAWNRRLDESEDDLK